MDEGKETKILIHPSPKLTCEPNIPYLNGEIGAKTRLSLTKGFNINYIQS